MIRRNERRACGSNQSGTRPLPAREDGVVIIAVLWICALIMWFALQISAETRLKGEEQVHRVRRAQALYLAIGGCYEALARMGQPLPLGFDEAADASSWQPDGKPHVVDYQTGQALVIIESEAQKVNVNTAGAEQLKAVLERAGVQEDAQDRIADTILDFVDKDDLPRLSGSEKDAYERQGLHHVPFNGRLLSLDQMLLIPGVTQQLFYGYGERAEGGAEASGPEGMHIPLLPGRNSLFQLLTVYGTNTLLRDEESDLERERPIVTWEDGGIYRILSCGAASGSSPVVVIWLIVRYAPEAENGYEVLYRKVL